LFHHKLSNAQGFKIKQKTMEISPTKSACTDTSVVSDDSYFELERAGRIISIEGNIGSGKTTLLGHVKETLKGNPKVIFLKEPVDDWETIKDNEGHTMLQKFYADQEKYSFPFQMMAYISRLVLLKEAIKMNPNATLVTERSLFTDKMVFAKMLFESCKIEDVNYQIYLKWFDAFADECPVSQIVYVRTDPNLCHERITKRSRTGEDCIPLGYLQDCHKYHESMLDKFSKDCVCSDQLILNGDVDIFETEGALLDMIDQVTRYIGCNSVPVSPSSVV